MLNEAIAVMRGGLGLLITCAIGRGEIGMILACDFVTRRGETVARQRHPESTKAEVTTQLLRYISTSFFHP